MHIYFPIFPFSFVIFIESVSKLLINPSETDLNDSFQISIFRGFKILNRLFFSACSQKLQTYSSENEVDTRILAEGTRKFVGVA